MRILAIEQSSRVGSIALLEAEQVLFENRWEGSGRPAQEAFLVLRERLTQGALDLHAVDLFAVGVGPGSFSGLRMAVATVCAMALPHGREVFAISSGEALAGSILRTVSQSAVVIVGDARREQVWLKRFDRQDGTRTQAGPWSLTGLDGLAAVLPPDCAVATPDWDRLAARLRTALPAGARLLEGPRVPAARDVGQAVFRKRARGLPSEALAPIYLHPPVFVAPRFPA